MGGQNVQQVQRGAACRRGGEGDLGVCTHYLTLWSSSHILLFQLPCIVLSLYTLKNITHIPQLIATPVDAKIMF